MGCFYEVTLAGGLFLSGNTSRIGCFYEVTLAGGLFLSGNTSRMGCFYEVTLAGGLFLSGNTSSMVHCKKSGRRCPVCDEGCFRQVMLGGWAGCKSLEQLGVDLV